MTTKTVKAKVKSVALNRLDGRRDELGTKVFCTWEEAGEALRQMVKTAPVTGDGHEVEFTITWHDGASYQGALVLYYQVSSRYDLAARIRYYIETIAGLRRPAHLSELEYSMALGKVPVDQRAHWADFVAHHELTSPCKVEEQAAALMYADDLLASIRPAAGPSTPAPAESAEEGPGEGQV